MNIVPTVIEKMQGAGSMVSYDLVSRMLKDRIIFLGGGGGAIDTDDANLTITQLLYLESEDSEKPISLYINSPGGSVTAGLAIYDTMMHIKSPVHTICNGMAMSFGAVLLAAGKKGHRYALPNARIMIHQPLIHGGGISGQATDIEIESKEIIRYKKILTEIIAKHCGKPYKEVLADCERNCYLSPEEAVEYGLIDSVLHSKKEL